MTWERNPADAAPIRSRRAVARFTVVALALACGARASVACSSSDGDEGASPRANDSPEASASDASTDAPVPIVCPPGPPSSANDVLRPTQHDGQTFVTWQDSAEDEAGAATRYDVYRGCRPSHRTTVDEAAWGIVTITGVSIAPGQPTTVTLTADG